MERNLFTSFLVILIGVVFLPITGPFVLGFCVLHAIFNLFDNEKKK
jgi:hypothetical protein